MLSNYLWWLLAWLTDWNKKGKEKKTKDILVHCSPFNFGGNIDEEIFRIRILWQRYQNCMSNMPLLDNHFAVSLTTIKCSYHLITFLDFVVKQWQKKLRMNTEMTILPVWPI